MAIKTAEMDFDRALVETKMLLQRRQFGEADRRLKALAGRRPGHADVLGLQGMLASERGKPELAVKLLTKSLTEDAPPAIYRRNLSILTALANGRGEADVSRELLARIPTPDAGTPLGPYDFNIVLSLANQLAVLGSPKAAIELLAKFDRQVRADARALELLGALKLAVEEHAEAVTLLEQARAGMAPKPGLLIALSAAAVAARDFDAACRATEDYIEHFPTYVAPAHPTQRAVIGVANWQDSPPRELSDVKRLHFGGNFISQIAGRKERDYRVVSLLLNSPNALKALDTSPRPDVVYNSLVNPESVIEKAAFETLSTLLRIWDRPVINHPDKVLRTTRVSALRLYEGVEGLLVPSIGRYRKGEEIGALVDEIEAAFDYPVIVRGLVEQEGKNAFRVFDRAALEAAVREVKARPFFYVIQFYDNPHAKGFYRKIRAAVAGDVIQIVRVDSDVSWNVHGRKSEERVVFYQENADLLRQEEAICRDPDAELGPHVMATLRALRQRNPLDVFGVDFDVVDDGRLLFFEANASMNLLSSADSRVDHPEEAENRFMAAFDAYVDGLMAKT